MSETSELQAQVRATSLAQQTASTNHLLLYALLAGMLPIYAQTASDMTVDQISVAAANAPTASGAFSYERNVDGLLAEEMHRVMQSMASSQHELDLDSRRVLYSRMRELYLR